MEYSVQYAKDSSPILSSNDPDAPVSLEFLEHVGRDWSLENEIAYG